MGGFNWTILILIPIGIVISVLCWIVYKNKKGKLFIDHFSFLAALYLIIEGIIKIMIYSDEPFVNHISRIIRIIIGICIFSIHLFQYLNRDWYKGRGF